MQQATLRLVLSLFGDVGGTAQGGLNTNQAPNTDLTLAGFQARRLESIVLSASAADQAVTFTGAAWVVLYSTSPFSVRLAAGETLIGGTDGLHLFVAAGAVVTGAALQTSVLLTNPSGSEAVVQAAIIEATT